MTTTATPDIQTQAKQELARRQKLVAAARAHPSTFLDHVQCVDAKTGERFQFQLLDPAAPWYWQRGVIDGWMGNPLNLVLKARQIGITWLGGGYGLWKAIWKPGTRVLVVSINEDEAIKVVNRIWDMFQSLPPFLRNGALVQKPTKNARPSSLIELVFPDNRVSSIVGLPATRRAGHGETATLVLLDEFARHDFARDSWKALFPVADNGGEIIIISTANGISNPETGGGNFFHHLWINAEDYGIETQFLPWSLHPQRDEEWYTTKARALPPAERAESFPRDPEDAFINTGECWFDLEALSWYSAERRLEPEYRARFFPQQDGAKAKLSRQEKGWIRVYEKPKPDRAYVIGADVATGRGMDYSCCFVMDLQEMAIVAELHAKIAADEFAEQLHFLGRWYGNARLAVEMGGGYGEPVVIALRDGRQGRPHYPKLYRHSMQDRPDARLLANYGFPINTKTRPQIINQLERAIREKTLPGIPSETMMELRTFVRQDTLPSPRAQEGSNDDRVMALALTLELYRLYGHHEHRVKRTTPKRKPHRYRWQRRAA